MANTFKVKTVNNIGTTDSDVYTCPSATATDYVNSSNERGHVFLCEQMRLLTW